MSLKSEKQNIGKKKGAQLTSQETVSNCFTTNPYNKKKRGRKKENFG